MDNSIVLCWQVMDVSHLFVSVHASSFVSY